METLSTKFLASIFAVLAIFALIFVGHNYSFGNKVLVTRGAYQKQIATLEKELDKTAKSKEAKLSGREETTNKSSVCPSILTTADQTDIGLWSIYENSAQNYSFKYPQTWTVSSETGNQVVIEDDEASIKFQFRSEVMTQVGFSDYTVGSSENLEVACQDAHKTNYNGAGNSRMIVTSFTKDGTPHLVTLSYEDIGASISGDIVEAFDLILKTIEFK